MQFSSLPIKIRIEEAKRAMKRPAPAAVETDRYVDLDRKRSASDRRFEPPPPPRFDSSISRTSYERSSEKKRIDDYPSTTSSKRNDDYKSSRSTGGGSSSLVSDVTPFKRPIDDYPKRSSQLEPPRNTGTGSSSSAYDQRGVSSMSSASSKDHRFGDSVDSRGGGYGRSRVDERDSR